MNRASRVANVAHAPLRAHPLTNYPQGTFKLIPFRVHAFIELAEGLAVLAATLAFTGDRPLAQRLFLGVMGASQLGAFALSDYGPSTRRPTAASA
jgi:hypothetical protein